MTELLIVQKSSASVEQLLIYPIEVGFHASSAGLLRSVHMVDSFHATRARFSKRHKKHNTRVLVLLTSRFPRLVVTSSTYRWVCTFRYHYFAMLQIAY